MTATLAPPPAATTTTSDLVLVRMALPAKSKPAPKRVRADVGKLLGTPLSAAEFDAVRRSLAAGGLLVMGRRNSFAITPAGRERAAQFLDLDEMPVGLRWDQTVTRYLFPKLAGLSDAEATKLKKGGKLAAFILERKFGFTSTKAPDLRLRLIRDRLASAPPPAAVPDEPFDLPAFAHTVLALARVSPPADRFHGFKVFIAPLWRASQREPAFPRLSLDQFKTRLIEANADGLLQLSRADLVPAMDPRLVAESETVHLNATFHFVRLEGTAHE